MLEIILNVIDKAQSFKDERWFENVRTIVYLDASMPSDVDKFNREFNEIIKKLIDNGTVIEVKKVVHRLEKRPESTKPWSRK